MEYLRVDDAIKTVAGHLQSTNSFNTEIENQLVGYLLIVTYSEFEQAAQSIFESRSHVKEDPHLSTYVVSSSRNVRRGIKIGELKRVLKHFHPDCVTQFDDVVTGKGCQVAYDNILNNRQALAHGQGANLSFEEFRSNFQIAVQVIEAFHTAINLRAS